MRRIVNKLVLTAILISLTACDALVSPKLPNLKRSSQQSDKITDVSVAWTRDTGRVALAPIHKSISKTGYLYKIELADSDALDVTLTFTTASGGTRLSYQIQDMGDYRIESQHEVNVPFGILDEMAVTTDGTVTFDMSFRQKVYVYVFMGVTPYMIGIEKPGPDRVIYVSELTGDDYDPTVTRGYLEATAFRTFSAALERAMITDIRDIFILDMLTSDSTVDTTSLFTISTTNDRLLRIHGKAPSTGRINLEGSDSLREVDVPGAGFSAKPLNARLTNNWRNPNAQTRRVFHITGSSTRVAFDNILIEGGGGVKIEQGGGLLIDGGAEVILHGNTLVTENTAVRGGGVYLNAGSALTAMNATIYYNRNPNADGEGSADMYHYGRDNGFFIYKDADLGKLYLAENKRVTVPTEPFDEAIDPQPTLISVTLTRTSYYNNYKVLDVDPNYVRGEGRFTIPSLDPKTQWSIEGGGKLLKSNAYFVGRGIIGYTGYDDLPATHGFKKTLPFATLERAIFAVMTNEQGRGWDTIIINGEIDETYHAVCGKIDRNKPDDDVTNLWDIRLVPWGDDRNYAAYQAAVAPTTALSIEYAAAEAESVFTIIMKKPVYSNKAADERGIVFLGLGSTVAPAKIVGTADKRVFYVGGNVILTFETLEISAGNIDGKGGAFFVKGNPAIANQPYTTDITMGAEAVITENTATVSGGGVHVEGVAAFHLIGGAAIKYNDAPLGSGVSVADKGIFRVYNMLSAVHNDIYLTETGLVKVEKGNVYGDIISNGEGEENINEEYDLYPGVKRPNAIIHSMGSVQGKFEMRSGYAFVGASVYTLDISGGTVETLADMDVYDSFTISGGEFVQEHRLQLQRKSDLSYKVIKMTGGKFQNKSRITYAHVYLAGPDASHKPIFYQGSDIQGDVYLAEHSDFHMKATVAKLDKQRFNIYIDHNGASGPYVTLDAPSGTAPLPPAVPPTSADNAWGANIRLWNFADATTTGPVKGKKVDFANPTHRGKRLLNVSWDANVSPGSGGDTFVMTDGVLIGKYFPVDAKEFELDDDGFLTSWIEAGEKITYYLAEYDDPSGATYNGVRLKVHYPTNSGQGVGAETYGVYTVFDAVPGKNANPGSISIAQPKDYYSYGKENYSWNESNAVLNGGIVGSGTVSGFAGLNESKYGSWKLDGDNGRQWELPDYMTLAMLKDKGETGNARFETLYLSDYGDSLKPDALPNPAISTTNIGVNYMYWTRDEGQSALGTALFMAMDENPTAGWTNPNWMPGSGDPAAADVTRAGLPAYNTWGDYYTTLASGHYTGYDDYDTSHVVKDIHKKASSYANKGMLTKAAEGINKPAQAARVRFVKKFKNRRVRSLAEFPNPSAP
ncbi:MAG: hypothetical protein Ta2A_11340 [Treponemataceae bacterium]|nr:MAG: hypothetical protein Ta2A_11340 [Treponemataceae bacterium]